MYYLFELGNTSLKFARYENGKLSDISMMTVVDLCDGGLNEKTVKGFNTAPTHVYFISVAQPEAESAFIRAINSLFSIHPVKLSSQPECCNLTTNYDNFAQLGADRWMAMLGAVTDDSEYLVVDAGTALTVDIVKKGQHRGGFVTPGLTLMSESMEKKLPSLSLIVAQPEEFNSFATSTGNAVEAGVLYMVASYLNRVVEDSLSEGQSPLVCIGTGGDFHSIMPLLDAEFEYVEELVFIGMIKVIESV